MIKLMATDNIRIGLIPDNQTIPTVYDVVLTIKGEDKKLTIDELQEIIRVSQNFWDVNNLYQHTNEAIAERKRWDEESKHPVTELNGLVTGRKSQNFRMN